MSEIIEIINKSLHILASITQSNDIYGTKNVLDTEFMPILDNTAELTRLTLIDNRISPSFAAYKMLAQTYAVTGQKQKAVNTAKAALWLNFTDSFCLNYVLHYYFETKQCKKYIETFNRASTFENSLENILDVTYTHIKEGIKWLEKDRLEELNQPSTTNKIEKSTNTKKHILFVSTRPLTREVKIAAALRSIGWRVDIIVKNEKQYSNQYKSEYSNFIQTTNYQDIYDYIAKHEIPYCQSFIYKQYALTTDLIINRPCKILLDIYDPLSNMHYIDNMYMNKRIEETQLEKFCLENCDGIVSRCMRIQHIKKTHFVDVIKQNIFFPDYCFNEQNLQKEKLSEKDGNLHIVFGGSIREKTAIPSQVGNDITWFAALANKFKFHFHIYLNDPTPVFIKRIRSDYVHVHKKVSPENWIYEISKYDAGIMLPYKLTKGEKTLLWNPENMKYSPSNRMFDYLDAEIFFLGAPTMLMVDWAKKKGFGYKCNLKTLKSQSFWDELKQKCLNKDFDFKSLKQNTDIKKHIHRLEKFYLSL
jgi:hypothetical protein